MAARVDYGISRSEVWAKISKDCIARFHEVARHLSSFKVLFSDVVTSDSAIFLVGNDGGQMSKIRHALKAGLPIPKETKNEQDIIHSTLFRYHSPLANPRRFWEFICSQQIEFEVEVSQLEIRLEVIYPSLKSQLLAQESLDTGSQAD